MHDPLPIEIANWAKYAKFLPVAESGYRLPNRTRMLLEYDESGEFIERDRATGAIIDAGVLEGIARRKDVQEAA